MDNHDLDRWHDDGGSHAELGDDLFAASDRARLQAAGWTPQGSGWRSPAGEVLSLAEALRRLDGR